MRPSITKERLRKRFLEIRRELSFEEVYRLSARVQERFLLTPGYRRSRHLCLYSSFQNEVLTEEILRRAVSDGKDVYYPSVVRGIRHLEFYRVKDPGELSPGSYDIPEPRHRESGASPGVFDLVVVPGVVFDLRGARLGFGKGYYDRALREAGCAVVALAYEFQVLGE